MVADLKAKGVPLKGTVGLVSTMAGIQVLTDRDQGFRDRMKEIAPDVNVLETRFTDNGIAKSLAASEDIGTSQGDTLIGVFADNNHTGDGVARMITERTLGDKIVAMAFRFRSRRGKRSEIGGPQSSHPPGPLRHGVQGLRDREGRRHHRHRGQRGGNPQSCPGQVVCAGSRLPGRYAGPPPLSGRKFLSGEASSQPSWADRLEEGPPSSRRYFARLDLSILVRHLPAAHQEMVTIAKAVYEESKLIVDAPKTVGRLENRTDDAPVDANRRPIRCA
jgi:hypothetical protein